MSAPYPPWMTFTPSVDVIRDLLDYDPSTGLLTWSKQRAGVPKGQAAGFASGRYRLLRINGVVRSAHRTAWAHYFGEYPTALIDHINGDGRDNRITNLRIANTSQNQQNRHAVVGLVGFKGVSWHKAIGRFQVHCGGKYIGVYKTAEEAARAYDKEALQRFGPFAKTNFGSAT